MDKILATANLIYVIAVSYTKDELISLASALANGFQPEYELIADNAKIDELAKGKFDTQENETKYKQTLQIVSGIANGYIENSGTKVFAPIDMASDMDGFKRKGAAGGFALYVADDGNKS